MANRNPGGQNMYRTTNIADHANAILGNTYGDTFQIFVLGNNDVETLQPIALSSLLPMRQLKSLKESGELACSSQAQEKHRSLETTRAQQIAVLSRDIKAVSDRFPLAEVPSTNRFEATVVLTIFFGAVVYRNLPLTMLRDVFLHSTTDGVTTGVMMLFLAWLTNFLTRASLSTNMSGTSGDKLSFENAYKQRMQVPLAYFASEDIFRGFLRTHYKDSSAIKLVEAGSFYFMLGERFRQPVSLATLCSGKLAPNHVVIMSIRYRARTTSCIECTNKLYSSDMQSYLCSYCRRDYCIRENILPPSKSVDTAAFLQPKSRLLAWTFWTGTLDGLQNIDLDILPQRRPQSLQQPSAAYAGRKRANYKSATTSRTKSRLHHKSFLQKLIGVVPRATDTTTISTGDMPDFNESISLNRPVIPVLIPFHDSSFHTPVPRGYIANPMVRDTSLESNVSEPFPTGYAANPMARDTSLESNLSEPLPNTSSDRSSSYILRDATVKALTPEQSFKPELPAIDENKACQTPVLHPGSYEASLSEASLSEPSPILSPMGSPKDDDRSPLSSKDISHRIILPRIILHQLDASTLSRSPTRCSESRQKKSTLSRDTVGRHGTLYTSNPADYAGAGEDEDDEFVSESFTATTEEDEEDQNYRWWKPPSPKLSTQKDPHPQDDRDSTELIINSATLARHYLPDILLTKGHPIDHLSTKLSSLRPAATGIGLSQVDTTVAIGQIGSSLTHTNQSAGLIGTYAMDMDEYLMSRLKRASR